MKTVLAVLVVAAGIATPAHAQQGYYSGRYGYGAYGEYLPPPAATRVTPNGYGLGTNVDVYGRPHTYRTQNGAAVDPIFQGGVKRDGFGPGVHQDQFGRPVYDSQP